MSAKAALTNEEKRVVLYSVTNQPTISSEVTPATPLEELNLNWREKDLPEGQRTKHVHRLHPYLGKFVPQLVEIFLRKYFRSGQTVLDPFCGSGTTLVQANELGINAIGCDVSAFNVLLCKAKTASYELNEVKREVLDVLGKVEAVTQRELIQATLWEPEQNVPVQLDPNNSYLARWFAPQALLELLTYNKIIETEKYQYKDLLRVILSRSARSARLTTHFDLDFPKQPQTEPYWCYKHSRECYPTSDAFKFLKRYSFDTLKRVKEFAVKKTEAATIIHHADSRNLSYPPIHGVITSPPYVGLIDYHEQHTYAYNLLGLKDKREQEIGAAVNGSSQKAKQLYQRDIADVLSHAAEALVAGGRMIVVAADKANLYTDMAALVGLEEEAILQRHVNRRTGRRSSEFYESIFIWRKP